MPYWNAKKKRWVGQVIRQGKKYHCFRKSKTEAKQWEAEKRIELKNQANSLQIRTVSLLDFASQYLDFSKMKFSKKTYEEKKFAFRLLFTSIDPGCPVGELHQGDILSHLQQQAETRSGNAANKDRKNLVAAWNWGCKYIPDFPAKNPFLIDRFPEIRSPRYVPSEDDFWRVFHQAESFQDEVLLIAFLHLAARRNEVFNLRREDVNFENSQIRLYTRKRKDGSLEFDWLPLTGKLEKLLHEHLSMHKSEWIFPNPKNGVPYLNRNKWLPRLCKKAQVKPFGIHGIRHLSASILVQNGISLIDIQTILRHKNITTTQRYIHRLESVRSAMEVFKLRKGSTDPSE